jgi:phage shock protein E
MRVCSLQEFSTALKSANANTFFLDVRTPEEFAEGHIAGTINLPVGQEFGDLEKYKRGSVYVFCESNRRSRIVASLLENLDVPEVVVFGGGMFEWTMNDGEVIK